MKPRDPKSDRKRQNEQKCDVVVRRKCEMPSSGRQETQEKCPTYSKPTCTRNGGKIIQVKPRDKAHSKDLTMRCCGVQKCKMPHTAKNIAAKLGGIKTPKI